MGDNSELGGRVVPGLYLLARQLHLFVWVPEDHKIPVHPTHICSYWKKWPPSPIFSQSTELGQRWWERGTTLRERGITAIESTRAWRAGIIKSRRFHDRGSVLYLLRWFQEKLINQKNAWVWACVPQELHWQVVVEETNLSELQQKRSWVSRDRHWWLSMTIMN